MKKGEKHIYLDVCVLCRPFDDQTYLRIRLETEAVNLILSKVKNEDYRLIVSPIHWEEIKVISETFERIDLQERLKTLGKSIKVDLAGARKRAEELCDLNFGVADAAHIAFAEQCGAEFISCDDCNFSISPGNSYFATIQWIPAFAGMTGAHTQSSFPRRRESSDWYPDLLRNYR